jgi:hypothetical protein
MRGSRLQGDGAQIGKSGSGPRSDFSSSVALLRRVDGLRPSQGCGPESSVGVGFGRRPAARVGSATGRDARLTRKRDEYATLFQWPGGLGIFGWNGISL